MTNGKYEVYGSLMNICRQDEKPSQPKREDRTFLRYPPKPKLIPVKDFDGIDEQGNSYSFTFQNLPIIDVFPRTTIEGIKFKSLQIWLDHLGEAIYNPLSTVQLPSGKYVIDRDSDHRTRCLWEIGEPEVAVMVKKINDVKMNRKQARSYVRWYQEIKKLNDRPPKLEHFWISGLHQKRYYPAIEPIHPSYRKTMERFFADEAHDGKWLKEDLDSDKSFREILFSRPSPLNYREEIVDAILNYVDITGKTIFDVGCHFGYYSLLLLESGAFKSICIDTDEYRLLVLACISRRRSFRTKRYKGYIQRWLESNKNVKFDVVLLLNVFHHILGQKLERDGWWVLNELLKRSKVVFLMMETKDFDFLKEFDNDVVKAVTSMTYCKKVDWLIRTNYRHRDLYALKGVKE